MSKYAAIALTALSGMVLVGASLLAPGTTSVSPAYAQQSTSSSTSSSTSYSSIYSSSAPSTAPSSAPPVQNNPSSAPPVQNNPAGGPTPEEMNFAKQAMEHPTILVACSPAKSQPDLKFRNIGNQTVPGGTRISWTVPATGEHGIYTAPKDIKPGEEFPDSGALAAALGKDGHCLSKVL